jgi:hypothetical protein
MPVALMNPLRSLELARYISDAGDKYTKATFIRSNLKINIEIHRE